MVGFYITKKGKHRRMDVIMPIYDELPFCLISWTGECEQTSLMSAKTSQEMHLPAK